MAFGKRIKLIRQLRGLTQRELGERIGFSGKAADIRIAQYESETRKPKDKIAETMAAALEVPAFALNVPDIDSNYGIMHTLFALEDEYGFQISNIDDKLCITLDKNHPSFLGFFDMLNAWQKQNQKLQDGEITQEEYDAWRYAYPASSANETKQRLAALRSEMK